MNNFICFDLEGPLSRLRTMPLELMKLFPDGGKIFEVISRYDDLLTLAEKEGTSRVITLALIVPFPHPSQYFLKIISALWLQKPA